MNASTNTPIGKTESLSHELPDFDVREVFSGEETNLIFTLSRRLLQSALGDQNLRESIMHWVVCEISSGIDHAFSERKSGLPRRDLALALFEDEDFASEILSSIIEELMPHGQEYYNPFLCDITVERLGPLLKRDQSVAGFGNGNR